MTQAEFDKLIENQRQIAGVGSRCPHQTLTTFHWESNEIPPSTNDLVRPAVMGMHRSRTGKLVPTVRLVKTTEAQKWLDAARAELELAARQQRHRLYRGIPVRLELDVVVPSISSDATNRVKALEDACKGIVWADDCQVVEAVARKHLAADVGEGHPLVKLLVEHCSAGRELSKRLAKSKEAGAVQSTQKE